MRKKKKHHLPFFSRLPKNTKATKKYNSWSPGSPKTPTPRLQRQIPRVLRLHIRGNGVAPVEEGSWDGNPDDLESCGARGGDKTSPVTPNMGRIVMDIMVYEKNPEISLCDSVCVFCCHVFPKLNTLNTQTLRLLLI